MLWPCFPEFPLTLRRSKLASRSCARKLPRPRNPRKQPCVAAEFRAAQLFRTADFGQFPRSGDGNWGETAMLRKLFPTRPLPRRRWYLARSIFSEQLSTFKRTEKAECKRISAKECGGGRHPITPRRLKWTRFLADFSAEPLFWATDSGQQRSGNAFQRPAAQRRRILWRNSLAAQLLLPNLSPLRISKLAKIGCAEVRSHREHPENATAQTERGRDFSDAHHPQL